jgi:hypothetical protein
MNKICRLTIFLAFLFLASNLVAKEKGFTAFYTEHATIFYQDGVSKDRACEVGRDFEIAYKVVGKDLGYPKKKPRFYLYNSGKDMNDDLINNWGHGNSAITKYRLIPQMNWDYIAWIPPNGGIDLVAHEYSHRIMRQIADLDFLKKSMWFNEGVAEYTGLKALAVKDTGSASSKEKEWLKNVISAYRDNNLIPFKEMMTDDQWMRFFEATPSSGLNYSQDQWNHFFQTGSLPGLNYNQSAVAVSFIINQYGFDKVKKVLKMVGKGKPFPEAFQKVYGFSQEEFEAQFKAYLAGLDMKKIEATSTLILVFTVTTPVCQFN